MKWLKSMGVLVLTLRLALAVQEILLEMKDIKMNIDGANAGILSDMGFDWRTGTGIFMIGRLTGINITCL